MDENFELNHDKFRNLIKEYILILNNSCKELQEEMDKHSNLSEEVLGEINVVDGQSELLIKEKFSQFSTLIEDSELKKGEKEITLQDLQGFWDIIYLQVESILKRIENLNKLKDSNWKLTLTEITSKPKVSPKKKKLVVAAKPKRIGAASGKSNVRDHISALRKKMKEKHITNDEKMDCEEVPLENKENIDKQPQSIKDNDENEEIKSFDAGFFNINTPVKTPRPQRKREKSAVKPQSPSPLLAANSLRKRLLNTPTPLKDYSPFMRVTRSMKKRILETRDPKSSV